MISFYDLPNKEKIKILKQIKKVSWVNYSKIIKEKEENEMKSVLLELDNL